MSQNITAGTRRCPFCHKIMTINEAEMMWFQEHYYHNACYENMASVTKLPAKQYIEDKKELLNYITQIFDEDYLSQKLSYDLTVLLRQNFTYQGILATLQYYNKVKRKPLNSEKGISLVTYYYVEAKRYYERLYQAREKLAQQIIQNQHDKIISITLPPDMEQTNIDINSL